MLAMLANNRPQLAALIGLAAAALIAAGWPVHSASAADLLVHGRFY